MIANEEASQEIISGEGGCKYMKYGINLIYKSASSGYNVAEMTMKNTKSLDINVDTMK